MTMIKEYLSYKQVGRTLRISYPRLLRLLEELNLDDLRLGHVRIVRAADVERIRAAVGVALKRGRPAKKKAARVTVAAKH